MGERGADWGPALMATIYRTLGRGVCLAVLAPVIFYFYLAGAKQRRASQDYLARVWRVSGRAGRPGHWHGLLHFFAFGESLIDKFAAWIGHIDRDDVEAMASPGFEALRDDPRGALILSAHVGATEIIRAIASRHERRRVNVVYHTTNAKQYNDMIKRFAPNSRVALIEAGNFDVTTAMTLSEAVGRGEWVVMMGDRMPVKASMRGVKVDFLGAPAFMPQGPFVLAAALRCPIYLMFCTKQNNRHRVQVSLMNDETASMPRHNRKQALQALVERFARALEALVVAAPYQWFNFYDFWAKPEALAEGGARDGNH